MLSLFTYLVAHCINIEKKGKINPLIPYQGFDPLSRIWCFNPLQFLKKLKLHFSHLWPVVFSSSWLLSPAYSFFAAWYVKIFQALFVNFLSHPWNQHSPRNSSFLKWELIALMGILLLCQSVSMLLQLTGIHIYCVCIYIHGYVFLLK